jgi:hypothetical protein
MKTPPDPPPSIERHSRKCAICTHPNRQAIDEAFLQQSPNHNIVKDYNLPSLSSLYRHAHATGLCRVRAVNRLRDCESTDSARQEHDRPNSNRESNRENKACPADRNPSQPNSNRESIQLEIDLTPTIQTPLDPNRETNAWYSAAARLTVNAEIQRMLIGK